MAFYVGRFRNVETKEFEVEVVTPIRLKFDNRIKADLPFHVLVRATF